MGELPDNVKRIDVFRVEYGKRKLCECRTICYEIDYQNRLVYCQNCSAIIDPFEAITKIARYYDRLSDHVEALLEQRRTIENYKSHLVVIKEIEQKYRAQHFSMVPCCPCCDKPFDLTEIHNWCNRAFLDEFRKGEDR